MYAVGFTNLGNYGPVWTVGNNGLQRIHNKTTRGWKSELSTMLKCNDFIVIVNDISQDMLSMNSAKFYDACMSRKIAYLRGEN